MSDRSSETTAAAVGAVGVVRRPVRTEPGPVVLTHGVHGGRIVDGAAVVGVRLLAHLLR